jgi:pteridine reductase
MPTALITGAGVRVGRAVAEALGDAGFDLVLHAHRSGDAVRELCAALQARGIKAQAVIADLSRFEGVQALSAAVRERASSLEVLVNSAAIYERTPLAELTPARFERMLQINLAAPLFLTQALLPLLQAATAPSVVNITDTATNKPYPNHSAYLASKAALVMVTQALALELAPRVRVNGVAPGAVAFPADFDAAKRERILARVPLGKSGAPADVARAVLFLVRDAPYTTGHIVSVDGGLALG